MTHRLDFIDVSHYQADAGTINWSKVKLQVDAVIIKATEGSSTLDKKYQSNRTEAEAAGLKVATYHYLHHDNVSRQMEFYLDTVRPARGERMCIDYEHSSVIVGDLIAAVSYLQDNAEVEISVYGAMKLTNDVNAYTGDASCLKDTSLWAARYSENEPQVATKIWPTWTAWQYSQEGKIDGISGNVDCNMFNGSHENMLKWFGPASEEPVPSPMPEAQLAAFTVPAGQRLVITVNGEIVYER